MARRLHGRARCIVDNLRTVRALLKTHSVIGILPKYACTDLLSDPLLHATPLPVELDAWLLVQNHLKRDRVARVVINWLRDSFSAFSAESPASRPGAAGHSPDAHRNFQDQT
jgi:DNA-binding transcriptional LysR family regulator